MSYIIRNEPVIAKDLATHFDISKVQLAKLFQSLKK